MRTLPTLAVFAVTALLLGACGGDDPDGGTDDAEVAESGEATATTDVTPSDSTDETAVPDGSATALWVVASGAGEMYRVDLATETVSTTVELSASVYDVEVAGDTVWALNGTDKLYRVDAATGEAQTLEPGELHGIAAVGDELWVGLDGDGGVAQLGPTGTLGEGLPVATVAEFLVAGEVLYGFDDLSTSVSRIDTATGEVVDESVGGAVGGVALGADHLWVATEEELLALDPTTLADDASAGVELETRPTAAVTSPDAELVWLGLSGGAVVTYDPATRSLGDPKQVATDDVSAMVLVGDDLWVAAEDGSLQRLDATTLEVGGSVVLPGAKNQLDIAVER